MAGVVSYLLTGHGWSLCVCVQDRLVVDTRIPHFALFFREMLDFMSVYSNN